MTTTEAPQLLTFQGAQRILASALPGYRQRPQQEGLAAAIESALADSKNLMAQAGCGTGKSLGALIPAILLAKRTGQRVIVATATKALQTQYAESDLPFLEASLGVPFKWAILKGRSNYSCTAKEAKLRDAAQYMPSGRHNEVLAALENDPDHSGDRDELPLVTNEAWGELSTSAAECPGKKECPFGDVCKAEKAKARAQEADIVITNIAMLVTDIRLRQITHGAVSLLGEFSYVIFDEAHNLPDIVTDALSDSLGPSAFNRVCGDADKVLADFGYGDSASVRTSADTLWGGLRIAWDSACQRRRNTTDPLPFTPSAVGGDLHSTLLGALEDLSTRLGELAAAVRNAMREIPRDEKVTRAKAARVLRRLEDWELRVQGYWQGDPAGIVSWLEREETMVRGRQEMRLYLRSAPIDIAPFMIEHFWSQMTAILMSATLSSGQAHGSVPDFGYLQRTLGLQGCLTFDAGTPFDYASQALLFTPDKSVPAPAGATTSAWRVYVQEVTQHLVTEAGGGALLLFTSRSAMEESYRVLAPRLQAAGLTCLKQGDKPNKVLKEEFARDTDSVLWGLKTFMEGIDIQGDALRLVVLDKLPFVPPTDLVFKARGDLLVRQHGSWADFRMLSIPLMCLVLEQAFGRLIRTVSDRGVVAVLDSRLHSKGYGRQILSSLPPASRTSDIHQAAGFFSR